MENEMFGTIMYEGKMVNLDKEDINNLKKMSEDLKAKVNILENKVQGVFRQGE